MRPVPPLRKKKMTPGAKNIAGAFHTTLTRLCKGLAVYCSADFAGYGVEIFHCEIADTEMVENGVRPLFRV